MDPEELDLISGTGLGSDSQDDANADMMSFKLTDDLNSAFAEDMYVWHIPTGRYDDEGRATAIEVTVRDPKQSDLPVRYIQSQQKGQDEATFALFRACVVNPISLKNREVFDKLTTAFRSTLTYRLLGMIGVNGDFFTALATMGSQTASRPLPKSTTMSPPVSEETQVKSEGGTQASSSKPTPMHAAAQ